MRWMNYLPHHWQIIVREYLENTESRYSELSVADFTHDLRIKFEDGSNAFFNYAFYLIDHETKEVAVFTEHCGYHVFPFALSSIEKVDKQGNILSSESFLID